MQSCIYQGHVDHRRIRPTVHEFRYGVHWLYLDLREIDLVLRRLPLLSQRRWAPAAFRIDDHLESEESDRFDADLVNAIRHRLRSATGQEAEGPICLLTPLRHFGFYFSPISLYYCWNPDSTRVNAVIAEVNNTPWREKHWYVLAAHNRTSHPESGSAVYSHPKDFHVSPFMEMNQRYDWAVSDPAKCLQATIATYDQQGMLFSAALQLRRQPLTNLNFCRMLLRYPVAPLQVLSAIHFEAFRLWCKKVPFIPHPATHREPRLNGVPTKRHG